MTSGSDSGAGTLRDSISEAAAGTRICFAQSLNGQTITLAGNELMVAKDLEIDAQSLADGITIDADNRSRVFIIAANATVKMWNMGITGGTTPRVFQQGGDAEDGGGIYNSGSLELERCKVFDNNCSQGGQGIDGPGAGFGNPGGDGGDGGGIYSSGELTLIESELFDNNAGAGGSGGDGVPFNPDDPDDGNTGGQGGDGGSGGGIYSTGGLSISASTISGNRSGFAGFGGQGFINGGPGSEGAGGGIYSSGASTLHLSTIAENESRKGGIFNSGEMSIVACTIVFNETGIEFVGETSSLSTKHSIIGSIDRGFNTPQVFGIASNFIGNHEELGPLDGSNVVLTFLEHGSVNLGRLGYYGGPTKTYVLEPDSSVVGRAVGTTPVDQRGVSRPRRASLGATEPLSLASVWQRDLDRDGLVYGLERAIGNDPTNADRSSSRRPTPIAPTSGSAGVTFGFNQDALHELEWVVRRSTDLGKFEEILRYRSQSTNSAIEGVSFELTEDRMTVIDSGADPMRTFYTLEAELIVR